MLRSIVDYWGKLKGSVHPEDAPVFERFREHGFDLEYPPPAYIGDILNAPVIILDNNGGFNAKMTPAEFPDPRSHDEYRSALAAPRPLNPSSRTVSPYYLARNYTPLLTSGQAALVNGVAYRSINGRSNRVVELTKVLPSARFHQDWLRHAVRPLVESGERFLVIHRWTRWNAATDVFRGRPGSVFSTAPVSKDLTRHELEAAETFLRERRGAVSRSE